LCGGGGAVEEGGEDADGHRGGAGDGGDGAFGAGLAGWVVVVAVRSS
jgi:hypothetical protein